MYHNKPSYEELLRDNARLKELIIELKNKPTSNEQAKLNIQLNEHIEELSEKEFVMVSYWLGA